MTLSTMLNQAPIFINAFSRGGSNILWNILLSHPDVCSPIVETLEIFRIGQAGKLPGYASIWHTRQLNFFNQKKLSPRKPISDSAKQYIDRILYDWKLKTFTDSEMRFKGENQTYNLEEVKSARLCAKNNNGLTFLSDILLEMYPDATFFGLVRDPVALYESHKRRNIVGSLEEFVTFYNALTSKMLMDAESYPSYFIVRFEDILREPQKSMLNIYSQAKLDPSKAEKLRLKSKEHYRSDGTRAAIGEAGHHYWLNWDEAESFLEADINSLHIQYLSDEECIKVQEGTKVVREKLGY